MERQYVRTCRHRVGRVTPAHTYAHMHIRTNRRYQGRANIEADQHNTSALRIRGFVPFSQPTDRRLNLTCARTNNTRQ
jgi:hypothetical protein